MIPYILQTTLCWAAFYGLYAWLLSRVTFFNHNRAYLLGSLLLGLLLPLADWQLLLPAARPELLAVTLQPITLSLENLQVAAAPDASGQGPGWWEVLQTIYWLGVVVAGLRFAYGLRKLWRLFRASERRRQDGYTLVATAEWHPPFSFFHYLFWSRQMPYAPEDEKKIIRHERAHMDGWHSLDVLLLEALSVLFWPSPMIYLYSRSLRVVHEYLADAAVLRMTGKKKQYGHLLLSQSQSGPPIVLANHFINSQLKKRIVMMTKTKSRRHMLTRYLLALPLIPALALIFASAGTAGSGLAASDPFRTLAAPEAPAPELERGDVDRMPLFAGCEAEETEEAQGACTKKKLVEFMINNLKYPEAARAAKVEGNVLVQFTIAKDGAVQGAEVLKGIGYGCDEAALAVVQAMPDWTPAMKNGEPVALKMTLPFTFSLPREKAQVGESQEEVFKVVEEMPRFPGCGEEGLSMGELVQCSNQKMLEFIYNNIKYPQEARNAGIQGTAVASFVVDKEGWVKDVRIVRGIHESIDAEVARVVKLMNEMDERWIPGRQGGKLANVQFNLPVKFALPEEEAAGAEEQLPGNAAHIIGFGSQPEGAPAGQVGKERLELHNFQASPNPTTGLLYLRFEAAPAPTTIRILDANGQEVVRETLSRFEGTYDQALDLGKLPKGGYILHISQGERVFVEKVVVK
ncbi:MAG: TonB family protein [Lewinellaceae bacterium]|nr:TonB family protein [Lewinellaceae bacterium]